MYRTIRIGERTLAKGAPLRSLVDGRIEIDAGHARLSGHPVTTLQPSEAGSFHGALRKAWRAGICARGVWPRSQRSA